MANTKSVFAALIAVAFMAGFDVAEAAYRANYEAVLVSAERSRIIRTAEFVVSGLPLAQALEQYQLVLVPTISADGTYTVAVSLKPETNTAPQDKHDSGQSFSGKVGTPLDIKTNVDGVAVSVAFMLYEANE
ncbi:hypothetical protein C7S18_22885 [Ahniella affigens]|uniref:DUF4426 domain-containing protein n=1 Tax=Ahniella affigens TaxID=2021234 RepID=A0A2P1PYD2_9GAMM|nr:hypothetical protein [Ahniella affigens]AVP99846.1 hypothetical protein C7S18_22885 [Ahniella affigens]